MTLDISEADTLLAASRIGQVVAGKYRLERLIGRGGMGEVYEARHVVVGRRFAVKFLHAHLSGAGNAPSRFAREARAAGSLDSPHIAAVLDFDTAPDGSPFLVMEYLTGESLARTLLREGRLPLARAIAILLQVCEGLEVAHRAGIVHRDLKPDNLFVSKQKDGRDWIKILDFGIAKLVEPDASGDVTQSGAVLGTPYYMAPEQARGEKTTDRRCDIYALGVLAYELLSGQKPHPGEGYNSILAHILTQPIAPLRELRPELPAALVRVVERALAFAPAERHTTAALLADELSPFAGREVAMNHSHFDLRTPAAAGDGTTTRTTSEAPLGATAGTLSSAVGDVRGSRAEASRRRVPWLPLSVAIAAAALIAFKLREGGSSPPRHAAPSAQRVASTTPAANSVAAPALPSASAPPPMLPSAAPSVKRLAPTPASSLRRRAAAPETTFDEKNPY